MATSRGEVLKDGWTSEVASGFALAGFLTVVFLAVTLLAIGPLAKFDAYFNLAPAPKEWLPVLHALDRIGQRAVCLPVLGLVTYLMCRRTESWRPAVVVAVSVFVLNLLVLILKIGLGRGTPRAVDPSFFSGGMAYPSGHSANIVLVYGLVAFLLTRYGDPGRNARRLLWAMVPVLSVIMVYTSLTLNWHWFTDLLAGLVVGGVVLQTTASIDQMVPDRALSHLWRRRGREMVSLASAGKPDEPVKPG